MHRWRIRLILPPLLVILLAAALPQLAGAALRSATRLPQPVQFTLETETAADAAMKNPARVEISLQRGRLNLGLRNGEHLLAATGSYEWDVDQPSLTAGEKIVFRAGRTDLRLPTSLPLLGKTLPTYDLALGSTSIDYHLGFVQGDGRSELNLAAARLAGCELTVNSGNLDAWFRENAADCNTFTATLNAGTLRLTGLAGLGAAAYRLVVNSGLAQIEFGTPKRGMSPEVVLLVNSGTVNIKLPPDLGFQVELAVKSGLVYLAGERYTAGSHHLDLEPASPRGVMRIEVNSGIVRIH